MITGTMFILGCIVLSDLFMAKTIEGNPIVDTIYGTVEGSDVGIHTGDVIESFLGIPYAAPPVGELRFAPPERPEIWDDVFLAKEMGNACLQRNEGSPTHTDFDKYSEDCLNLNIYTPKRNSTDLLPVLFWIHGGVFVVGGNYMYPGYFLAAKDIVVVTTNYRLNIYGFSSTGDDVVPGNMGVRDVIMALEYVVENIVAFGGDPDKITVAGESAGAAIVGCLFFSPLSSGMFRYAVLQSGSELVPWGIPRPEIDYTTYLSSVANEVGCPTSSSEAMVTCLRQLEAEALPLLVDNCTEPLGCKWTPVVDGSVIPDYPERLRECGDYFKVPEMIGMNMDEYTSLLVIEYPGALFGLTRERYDAIIRDRVGSYMFFWPDESRYEDVVQAFRFIYADWPYFDHPISNSDSLIRLLSAQEFGYPIDRQAKLHARDADTYFYVFDHTSENSLLSERYGTPHGADLPYVFGWPFMMLADNGAALNHSQANPVGLTDFTEDDRAVSQYVMNMWANFAKHGDPTPESEGYPEDSRIIWPTFAADCLHYAYLGAQTEVRQNFRQKEYAFWSEYLQYLIYGDGAIVFNV